MYKKIFSCRYNKVLLKKNYQTRMKNLIKLLADKSRLQDELNHSDINLIRQSIYHS